MQQVHTLTGFLLEMNEKTMVGTEAAMFLGISYPKFRVIEKNLDSVQLWTRGPKLYKISDLQRVQHELNRNANDHFRDPKDKASF